MILQKEFFSVGEITSLIKDTLEKNFSDISVIGEISNFKSHTSGHWYFTLKDSVAQISCTMWKGLNSYVFFTPQDGMKIIVKGRITVYPPRGNYQMDVRSMQPAGTGDLQLAFEALKNKLFQEGLFDEENKQEIPDMPEKVGLITSKEGAAVRDMFSVAKRRFPMVQLFLIPVLVQGAGAAEQIAAAIDEMNNINEVDVIVIARGGGSIEDLWCFNEEIVARAIYRSGIPVVTGIGHEIDFTIADFVADLRAATPTAAMEIILPEQDEVVNYISSVQESIHDAVIDNITEYRDTITDYLSSRSFSLPLDRVRQSGQRLDYETMRFNNGFNTFFKSTATSITHIVEKIKLHDPEKIKKKGFVLVRQGDKFVGRGSDLSENKAFEMHFFDKKVIVKDNGKS
ncbi:MAG: exodeoxyribonuclease VII large subunit [Ignavibacteriaceae bacterium]|nr:exodeoxyribonuclease VII large subunit [Ignavibacteriaceae bacterium]